MENIILTNNKDLRLVSVKVGVLSTLRFELPLVSASATHVEVIVTSGDVHSAYTATFIDATKRWQCDIAASQFPAVGKQSYEIAYVLDGKQFWDGKGWIEIEDATTSGIEPQPRPEPYRYAVVSVNGYGADAQGAVRIPKTVIATDSPATTEGYMEGDIYFNRETGATWTLCNVQGTLTWVFNYKNYYTKAETEEAIDRVAAYYITYDAAGNPFPTYASLANAQTVYSGGSVRVPTRNDYCVVLADETHQGAEYRYIYAVAEGQTTGSWQPQFPVEGVMTVDQSVTKDSHNPVSGGGIWSALWGAATTAFSSVYDWVVSKLSEYRDKLDLAVYGRGCAVSFPDGYSITYASDTYTAPSGGESIEFFGPISSTAVPQYNFWVPYDYKDVTDFDPQAQTVWCLYGYVENATPVSLMYGTGASYRITNWNTESPTLTLSNGEASGGEPTMARPLGATGDTLAKMSQVNDALSGKANNADVVHKTGDETIAGDKTFTGANTVIPFITAGQGAIKIGISGRISQATAGGLLDDTYVPNYGEVKSAIPYSLGNPIVINTAYSEVVEGETITYGAATLANRTANVVQVTAATALDELRITFPAATSGKVRDFGLRVEIGTGSAALTAPALVPIAPTGETIKIENADGTIPALADGTATAKGVTLLYFSETAPGVFVVKGEQVEEVA